LGAWYASLSLQLIVSGSWAGTVAAKRPPGFNTRTISAIAVTSSWMCSSTSDVITTSNASSPNGSDRASPRSTPVSRSALSSPASTIAASVLRVSITSSAA
jgi:hypothetical protein